MGGIPSWSHIIRPPISVCGYERLYMASARRPDGFALYRPHSPTMETDSSVLDVLATAVNIITLNRYAQSSSFLTLVHTVDDRY